MFYFEIVFKNDNILGGHNCTSFEIKDNFLIIEGYDDIPYVDDRQYWKFRYELAEIKEFKIEVMNEKE